MNRLFLTLLLGVAMGNNVLAEDILYPVRPGKGNLVTGFDGVTPVSFIIEGGANMNMYSGTVTWNNALLNANGLASNPVIDDVYGSAIGFGPHYAFGIDIPINDKTGITFRAGWDRKYVRNAVEGEFQKKDLSGNTLVENSWTKKMDYANYSLDFRYDLLERLSVNLGVAVDVVSRDIEATHWESLEVPLNQTTFNPAMPSWANGSHYDQDDISDNPLTNNARFGLELGIDYKIPVLERFAIVPYIRYQYFLTKLMDDRTMVPVGTDGNPVYGDNTADNWVYSIENTHMNTLQIGVALWFNFEKGGK